MIEKRPELNGTIPLKDFTDFYWLKEELISFCKENGIGYSGGKTDIASRILHFLKTGEKPKREKSRNLKQISKFDWNNEVLKLETTITDNYRNTENTRLFFTIEIGKHFKFNTLFMNWMKENVGKSLKDATVEWNRIAQLKKSGNYKSEIGSQFEYNIYMRDFLRDNPDLSPDDARIYWMKKRETRGIKKYNRGDLLLKKNEQQNNKTNA